MRKNVLCSVCASAIASGLIALSTPAAAADYLPVGPQQNVALSTVLGGGWSLCYSATYSVSLGNSALDEVAGCGGGPGNNIMLAGRATGSDTLLLLAQAPYADVFFNTGINSNVTHNANGSEWYYSDNYSWGFTGAGQSVAKGQCDTLSGTDRLCLHTIAGSGGWRVGNVTNLNDSRDYEKLIFVFSGSVPEPSTWAMMLLGFGGIGLAMRRERKVAALA